MLLLRLVLPGLIALVAGVLLPSAAQHGTGTIPLVLLAGAMGWAHQRLDGAANTRSD